VRGAGASVRSDVRRRGWRRVGTARAAADGADAGRARLRRQAQHARPGGGASSLQRQLAAGGSPNMAGMFLRMWPMSSRWILKARSRLTNSLIFLRWAAWRVVAAACVGGGVCGGLRGRWLAARAPAARAPPSRQLPAASPAATGALQPVKPCLPSHQRQRPLPGGPPSRLPPAPAALHQPTMATQPPVLCPVCSRLDPPSQPSPHPPTCHRTAAGSRTGRPAARSAPTRTACGRRGSSPR
jgi:hypothetical protein